MTTNANPQGMKYLYAFSVILVLAGGIWFSARLSEQPQSATKIAYTQFERPEELASLLHSKLGSSLKSAPLLLLGVSPGRRQDLVFWKAFLEQNKNPETVYQAIVVDPKLPLANEFFPESVKLDIKSETERFSEGAKNAKAQGIRMVVIVPAIYSVQVIEENPVNVLKKNYQLEPLSFSLVGFPRTPAEEVNTEHPCKVGDQNRDGTGVLGCVIQNRARPLYRVSPAVNKYEGLVDQMGERDYLIYWNPPRP